MRFGEDNSRWDFGRRELGLSSEESRTLLRLKSMFPRWEHFQVEESRFLTSSRIRRSSDIVSARSMAMRV